MIYAGIVIDISQDALDRPFQYEVPPELEKEVFPGAVVKIPFGSGNRERKGYIVSLGDTLSVPKDKIKRILSVCTGQETATSGLIALAAWMRSTYGSTMIQALRTVFPVQNRVPSLSSRRILRTLDPEELRTLAGTLSPGRHRARLRVLDALTRHESLDYRAAVRDLGLTPAVMDYLEKNGAAKLDTEQSWRNPLDRSTIEEQPEPLTLSAEQKGILDLIHEEWTPGTGRERAVLLRGVTGSGKTMVYMELIEETLARGEDVIVLIPEISLTFQTVRRFCSRFGDQVSVINSRLTAGERYDQFCLAKSGRVRIMVGPRSALFTPFSHLGLIIIDEEHESSYQSEHSPRYHARETALQRALMEHAHVLMGSATPSVTAYTRALSGEFLLAELSSRYRERPMPDVRIVDMRGELRKGNRTAVSGPLFEALEECLEAKEQAILFLNRRGYASFVSCRSCGEVIKCIHCDVALSEHLGGRLVCHYCGYERPMMKNCPSCGSEWIGGFRAGTQQVEKHLKQILPRARVLRMDFDTTRKKGSYEQILSSFAAGEADILIGTQMIVKGHDFPGVTLVGAIAADLSLYGDDFGSAERTFQLLTQAAGRAGRGSRAGRAFFQTYHPEHYCIQTAARQDYPAFYQQEMNYRTLMDYPPAAYKLAFSGAGREEELLQTAMEFLKRFVRKVHPKADLVIMGPAPDSVGKVRDIYHMTLYLKHAAKQTLIYVKQKTEEYIDINPGFRDLIIQTWWIM